MLLTSSDPLSTAIAAHSSVTCTDVTCAGECFIPIVKKVRLRPARSLQAEADFYKQAEERGFTIVGEYRSNNAKLKMICRSGHSHITTPDSFKRAMKSANGTGCMTCSGQCPIEAEKRFLDAADKFGATVNEKYISNKTQISITCKFGHTHRIAPIRFTLSTSGSCKTCAGQNRELTKEEYIQYFANIGVKMLGEYVGCEVPIMFECSEGHKLLSKPFSVKNSIHGCRICARKDFQTSRDNFLRIAHEREFTVLGEYKRLGGTVEMKCKNGHVNNINPQRFMDKSSRSGCRDCMITIFQPSKPASLYYIEFLISEERSVFKIGVTNNTVIERYLGTKTKFKFHWEKRFNLGSDALKIEKAIKGKFDAYRCMDKPVDRLSNTELFDKNVLPFFDLNRISPDGSPSSFDDRKR